ncbi:nucleotidyltransferase/DNA polymerase involved in DNA repair [Owenweeksia hongkongensis DSM 17368]|uniref:DNA polymerase IV n=1 Tax=Owenweeksia hongkongensis (strain DSM 17368 / CIP 108786 / JCM 12287 / NRRL B-23963 / UST20020801) TaxID=926562 RepID=G8R525_OWEHD|nr:DNA polymerase IV [Owenweeksia hongkongensis]AEV31036.1 nucleotidyltransferase/DNA polymerase involved in DNA repair [Owenweeksia hongkongensis DSM 17368]
MLGDRSIVHMDMDTFFVSCERLQDSRLNAVPLIIGGHSARGVVSSCSYETRYFGVRSGMPMKQALRLCPDAKVIKGDMELYSKYSNLVTEIANEHAPMLEKSSIDEFYIDISGMDRFFGCLQWTTELSDKIKREAGLPISFGLSVNKTVAKIATGEGKPLGRIEVPATAVRPFMNPLSIKKIPMLGNATFQILARIGIRKVHTLADMPVEVLQRILGKNGISLWKKANGIDNTPVEPYHERKSISTERTFNQDTFDVDMLRRLLVSMVENLGFDLRKENWLTSTITLKIRYSNFDTHTRQKRVAYTSDDQKILEVISELFDKLYERRMRLRLIGISFSGLVRGSYQIDLFEDTPHKIALYQAMDSMRMRYGKEAVTRAANYTPKPR